MELLYELGTNIITGFGQIDLIFKNLKYELTTKKEDKVKIRTLITQLESKLSSIFIHFFYSGTWGDNFGVLPIIDSNKQQNVVNNKDINLFTVERLHFFIGAKLIRSSEPRQMTAILLHEIGHVVNHVSFMTLRIKDLLHGINNIILSDTLLKWAFFPILIITSRTLNFRNHIEEHDADKFVNKFGYGDELASWLMNESNKVQTKQSPKINKLTTVFNAVVNFILGNSHPDYDKRLSSVIDNMKTMYSKEYDILKIDQILNEYYKNKRI